MMGVSTDEVILLTWGPVLGVSLEAGGIFIFDDSCYFCQCLFQ